jgi:hypothetical protein
MTDIDQKLKTANLLIKQKEWNAARAILEPIKDNPKVAKLWNEINQQGREPVSYLDVEVESPQTQLLEPVLICPKCEQQNGYMLTNVKNIYDLDCPNCHTRFVARIVTIRSKRSRGNKQERKRYYSVRVKHPTGHEDLLEFVTSYHQSDIELRAKDIVAFVYLKGKLKVVQNFTIRMYVKISEPSCYLATYVYGPDSDEVMMLRKFRDDVLLHSDFLSHLVTTYYRISPFILRVLGKNVVFKTIITVSLKPFMWTIRNHWKSDKNQVI